MSNKIMKFKIKGLPSDKDYNNMPFGRQMNYFKLIEEFKKDSKSIHLSQKRQTYNKAIKETIALYDVKEYYCSFYCDNQRKDDSFQFWFK